MNNSHSHNLARCFSYLRRHTSGTCYIQLTLKSSVRSSRYAFRVLGVTVTMITKTWIIFPLIYVLLKTWRKRRRRRGKKTHKTEENQLRFLLFNSNISSFTSNLCGFPNGVFIRNRLTRRDSSPQTRTFTSKWVFFGGEISVCEWGVEGKTKTKVVVSLLSEGEMFTKQTFNPTMRLMKETNFV